MPYPFEAEDRKFLHDLATPITVAKTMLRKCLKEISDHENSAQLIRQMERLEKSIDAIDQIEKMHAEQRSIISSRYADE